MSGVDQVGGAILTIGHSNHAFDRFGALLHQHGVTLVIDVRSEPYSKFNPQFTRAALEGALHARGVGYLFLGRELGARRQEAECYVAGVALYRLIANAPAFRSGVDRVLSEAARRRVALMCAEKDPLTCHRTILVARGLADRGVGIRHILDDGSVESHAEVEQRLLREEGLAAPELFRSSEERLAEAYARRAERIQYSQKRDSADAPA